MEDSKGLLFNGILERGNSPIRKVIGISYKIEAGCSRGSPVILSRDLTLDFAEKRKRHRLRGTNTGSELAITITRDYIIRINPF